VRVDGDGQRAEILDPELPEALGHELLPGDLLDLLDLRRLERGSPADDGEVDHPVLTHRGDRLVGKASLAADGADAVVAAERLGEAHHARARGRPDAELLVAAVLQLAHVRGRVQEERPGQVHRRGDPLVEDANLGAVPDADDVAVHEHRIARPKRADLLLGGRKRHAMLSHVRASSRAASATVS
jgi:hypothetical protein